MLVSALLTTTEAIYAEDNLDQNKQLPNESALSFEHDNINTDSRLAVLTENFRHYLAALNIEPDRMALQLSHATTTFSSVIDIEMSDLDDMQFPSWFSAGDSIPSAVLDEGTLTKDTFPDGKLPADFTSPSLLSAMYLGRLIYQRQCEQEQEREASEDIPEVRTPTEPKSGESTSGKSAPKKIASVTSQPTERQTSLSPDELRHLHRFMLLEQIWTQQDYEIVELAVARVAVEKNNDFSTKSTFQPDIIC